MKTCFGCGAEIQDDQRLCERCEYGDEGPSEYNWWGSAEYIPTPEEIEAACLELRRLRWRHPRQYEMEEAN